MSGGSYSGQANPASFHRDSFAGSSRGIRSAGFSRDATIGRHSATSAYNRSAVGRAPTSDSGQWSGTLARHEQRLPQMGGPFEANATRTSAAYVANSTQKGVPTGGLLAEMLERQRLHQKFERYVHEQDLDDQRKNGQEAQQRIRSTVDRLISDDEPVHYFDTDDTLASVGRGVAEPYEVQIETYGNTISKELKEISQQRGKTSDEFDDSKLAVRDALYGNSPFQAELQGPESHSGDPLGMTPPAIMQKPNAAQQEAGAVQMKKLDNRIVEEEAKERLYEDRRARYQLRPFNQVMNPLTGEHRPAFTSAAQAEHVAQVQHTQRTRMAAQTAMMTRAGERAYKGGVAATSKSFYYKPT